MKYTQAQQKTIDLVEGKHLILAPAGSGKTEVLKQRVYSAVASGVNPSSMLCVTFTNRAAYNMKSNISDDEKFNGLKIGSLHSICYEILTEKNLIPFNAIILDEIESEDIFYEAKSIVLESNSSSVSFYNVKFYQFYTSLTIKEREFFNVHFDPTDYLKQDYEYIQQITKEYEQKKINYNALDFDDLLMMTYHHLLSGVLPGSFPWVQIDEAQDFSCFQLDVIKRLQTQDCNFVVFADFEQSIYSFQGASIKALQEYSSGFSKIFFRENFRSPKKLLSFFNNYIKYNNPDNYWDEYPFSLDDNSEALIKKTGATNQFDEVEKAVRTVESVIGRYPNERVAILVRGNMLAEEISKGLLVDHIKLSGVDLFQRKHIKDFLSFLNVSSNSFDLISWSRILKLYSNIPSLRDSRLLLKSMFSCGFIPSDFIVVNDYFKQLEDTFNNGRFVVFDTETTGLDVVNDDIIQIAAIEIINGVVGSEFEVFIKTDKYSVDAFEIHKISQEQLIEFGLNPSDALQKFIDFVGVSTLVAHNADYDIDIVKHNLIRYGLDEIYNRYYDTVDLSKRLYPSFPKYKLEYLLEALNLDGVNSHNALDDVRATVNLFKELISKSISNHFKREEFIILYQSQLSEFSSNINPTWNILNRNRLDLLNTDEFSNFIKCLEKSYYSRLSVNLSELKYLVAELDIKKDFQRLNKHIIDNADISIVFRDLMRELSVTYSSYKEADLITDEKVFISTIHRSKGLEFETVLIVGVVDGAFPNFRSQRNNELIDEDKRLLYVAMTRAKKRLAFFYHHEFVTKFDKVHPKGISPFLWQSTFDTI